MDEVYHAGDGARERDGDGEDASGTDAGKPTAGEAAETREVPLSPRTGDTAEQPAAAATGRTPPREQTRPVPPPRPPEGPRAGPTDRATAATAEPSPGRRPGPSGTVVTVAAVVGVLVVAAALVLLWLSSRQGPQTAADLAGATSSTTSPSDSGSSSPSSSSSSSSSASPPAGATHCAGGANAGRRAATGNDVTSCEFALNVRDAWVASGSDGSSPTKLQVNSPVTKKNYTMTCSGDPLVTCRGGNGALVYLY